MRLTLKYITVTFSFVALLFLSCKKWDEHTKVANPNLNKSLFEEISHRPNLSKFAEYLVKSGLDKELNSSKTYTVWAPTNDALQTLDPAVAGDSARLRLFITNHISNQAYYSTTTQTVQRVPLLNGKRATFQVKKFDEATLTEADFSVRNGVLHVIDKAAAPLQNIWEYVNSTASQYKQNAFIISQNFNGFDPSLAIVDSISATTGQPIYRPGTGLVPRNRFNDQVFDLKREDKLYTYFVLNDAALKVEMDSLNTFYKTSTADSTYNLAAMSVLKDAMVEGMYTIDQLPPSLTSKFGITIPVDKNAIVETRRVSNGIVYVVNKLDFLTKDKIQSVIVQGENYIRFFRPNGDPVNPTGQNGGVSAVFTRIRNNPVTGLLFTDIFVYAHNITGLNAQYQVRDLPAAKYKVYWVAVNDSARVYDVQVVPVASFQQRLAIGSRTSATLPYVPVLPLNYNEVYLGEYTQPSFGILDIFLTAATSGDTRMSLDYIRLEPQF